MRLNCQSVRGFIARHPVLSVVSVAALMFLPALGSFGIMDPSDGLYAETAREMLESGDYLTPHFNYQPFFEKPILVYWIIALSFKVFGVSEFAARLPAALAAIETVVFVFLSTRGLISTSARWLIVLVLTSNVLFAFIGHLALTDMELTCLSTIAALSAFRCLNKSTLDRFDFALTTGALAATCLLKGPVIVVLLVVTIAVYKLVLDATTVSSARMTLENYLSPLRIWWLLLFVVLLSGPWYLIETVVTQGAFFTEFFIHQNIGRLTGVINHREPWWFYLPILLVAFVPWHFVLPVAIGSIKRYFRRPRIPTSRQRLLLFSTCWSLTCFVLFSIIKTKLPTYILPGVPLACVSVGMYLDTWLRLKMTPIKRLALLSSFAAFLVTGLVEITVVGGSISRYGTPSGPLLACFLLSACSIWCGGFALWQAVPGANDPGSKPRILDTQAKPIRRSMFTACSFWLAGVILFTPTMLLQYYQVKHSSLRELVLASRGHNLATFWRDTTAGVFYHRAPITLVNTIEDVAAFQRTAQRPHWIITTNDLIPFLQLEAHNPRLQPLQRSGNYSLFDLDE